MRSSPHFIFRLVTIIGLAIGNVLSAPEVFAQIAKARDGAMATAMGGGFPQK